ncbi:MAG: GLUG motif-containing protein [Ruminiclostridium sp.]
MKGFGTESISYKYSGTVDSCQSYNQHYDNDHNGKCDYCSYCGWSFWKISKPVNGKAIVKAGETTEIGGFDSGLNSDDEAYYHISPTYQWYSCDKNGDNKTAIDGATSDKYTLTAETAGESYYVCGVSFGGVEEYSEVITVKVPENPKYYNVTDGTAVDNIREALLDRSDYIELTLSGSALTDITSTNYGDKAKELYNSAFEHITETSDSNYANRSRLGDYIAKSVGETDMSMVCYTSDGTTVSKVVFGYEPKYYTDKSQEEQVTSKLSEIYSTLDLSVLSDQEKVYKIYNWIVNNVSYDYANLNNDENKTKYTAYGALGIDQKAVCQGFASLFYRMCLDNDIDCRIVTGTAGGDHAWNIVKVNDNYYYADPTWDCKVLEDAANNRQAKPGTFFYFLRGNLVNHTESTEENVTSAYTDSMAAADAYLSAFNAAVVDGKATAVHLDGTELASAELAWYDVDVTDGDGCKKNVAVKGKSTIVSDNGLANMELYSGETEVHTFGTDGFCTNGCSGVYQPATLTTDKYDIDGDNAKDEVYEIGNAGQLYWFADKVKSENETYGNANAILTADITVNAGDVANCNGKKADGWKNWTPIGWYDDNKEKDYNYSGTFDGQNHTVSGLYFNNTDTSYVGLFGYSTGTINNVGVVNSYFNGNSFVGGVCGYSNGGTITNCYNTGKVTGICFGGGVCGQNYKGTIKNCYNTGSVSCSSYVGGVCGANYSGTITNCYNTGKVSGKNAEVYVGGVCGYTDGGTISNCYNIGAVTGTGISGDTGHYVGGVCGSNFDTTITNCYNAGEVSGTGFYVGGVCGINNSGTIKNCYNTGAVSGLYFVGGVCGSNSATITNCYYLAETADENGGKTTVQFASGEVAFLLQSGQTADKNGQIPEVWGQTIGTDNYPVLGGAKVYKTTPCVSYSNENVTEKEHTGAETDGICDECGARTAYIVALTSQPDGVNASVAKLDGGGKINVGESTTIVAPAVPGYTFNGWFDESDTLVSSNLSFEYTPTADVTLTAKYTANEKMTVTIDGGTSYSISVNGGADSDYATSTSPSYEVGTKLTVTAKGENFAYWQNEAGSVLSRNAEYTFTVVGKATVTAVYNTKVDSKVIVNFISGYDQIINRYQIDADGVFTVPAAPTKTGCDFAGWSINGAAVVTENVAEAVKAAITAALATEDTSDDIINVKATYTAKVQAVTVTVENGTGAGTYNVNDIVTVTANEPESGYKFSHWSDGNGTILSYNTSYSFYAAKDITLTAVYVADTETVEAVGTTEIVDVIKDTVNGKISFVSMSTVPEGCTIVKAGVIATSDATVGTSGDGFNDTTAMYVGAKPWSGSAFRYTFTKGKVTTETWYARAYLVYTDKNGNMHTIYGTVVSANLNS